jgi:hypothetical protein
MIAPRTVKRDSPEAHFRRLHLTEKLTLCCLIERRTFTLNVATYFAAHRGHRLSRRTSPANGASDRGSIGANTLLLWES